eukprot:scaffold965_cov262-Pinguiococcus_pyrenoidosus.AAC.1
MKRGPKQEETFSSPKAGCDGRLCGPAAFPKPGETPSFPAAPCSSPRMASQHAHGGAVEAETPRAAMLSADTPPDFSGPEHSGLWVLRAKGPFLKFATPRDLGDLAWCRANSPGHEPRLQRAFKGILCAEERPLVRMSPAEVTRGPHVAVV